MLYVTYTYLTEKIKSGLKFTLVYTNMQMQTALFRETEYL